ncbi:hypothetical protein L226DRAFT_224329 [Lentinus tigrinus ALCF2SS1-7]|uniref:Protein kinase domain-containing protein n=1 Tax=Lentinus tigrinus ALCF2SS1-6 TaxID=1328759 RepID=A0A5C2RWV6_9APHY|nr:hypothetical protein L227DRAFT_656882 [Lentinus tigrinus ALCF2SS1-6]RPD70699.1 hypothetical protein L226DRAFT_224329 [Lentinus tigrinus ALCF2SS1-7]
MIQLQWPHYAPFLSESPQVTTGHTETTWYHLDPFLLPPKDVLDTSIRALVDDLIVERPDGNTQVFRATLRRVYSDQIHPDEQRVVCKVAYGGRRVDVLKREAKIYSEKLSHLQGDCVPTVFGCFVGTTSEGRTGVLVLQDGGVSLKAKLQYYELDIREKVVDALHRIHKAGVVHQDLVERNIVVQTRIENERRVPKVMIVDFGNSDDHVCPIEDDKIATYAPIPDRLVFNCSELYEVCMNLAETWRPSHVIYCSEFLPVAWAMEGPQQLIETAKAKRGIDPEDRDYAQRDAAFACKSLRNRISQRDYFDTHPYTQEWPEAVEGWVSHVESRARTIPL